MRCAAAAPGAFAVDSHAIGRSETGRRCAASFQSRASSSSAPASERRRAPAATSQDYVVSSVWGDEEAEKLFLWEARGLPEYMQQGGSNVVPFMPGSEGKAPWRAAKGSTRPAKSQASIAAPRSMVWRIIRREAARTAAAEPILSSSLHAAILCHDSFERSLAFILARSLASSTLLALELGEVFQGVLASNKEVARAALDDIRAAYERDPACTSYSQALLYFKGFHAIQAHRIAHELWSRGDCVIAGALQSRMSEAFAVDIHPGARFGSGILLDHGTGVVIGETVVVGNHVSILHGVTLGGTGKEDGDRHPKISDNVLIGACARILGNIRIGKGAQVAAGSTVLRPVPPHMLVAGAPAREIGAVTGTPALDMDQTTLAAAAGAEAGSSGSGVEAVSSDRAARRRWRNRELPPPEYLI